MRGRDAPWHALRGRTKVRPYQWVMLLALTSLTVASALEKPDVTYQVFQFPADKVPVIDGDAADWALVPESYVVDRSQMHNTSPRPPAAGDQTQRNPCRSSGMLQKQGEPTPSG